MSEEELENFENIAKKVCINNSATFTFNNPCQQIIIKAEPIKRGKRKRGRRKQNIHSSTISINYANFINSYQGPYDQLYELVKGEVLGRGGFGEVYKVIFKVNNEMRAMKVIEKKAMSDKNNFRKEFQILKELDHPNVLKLYHSFEDEKFFYIVSELCEGGTLLDYILSKENGIDEDEICKIIWQLMSAVTLAHSKKIVHRDIKPENILLEESDNSQIKLIDWGLLCLMNEDEKQLRQKCGSLHYVAPEVLSENYDEKCDIWSCGVVLYVLISGDPPFTGKDTQEVLQKIHAGVIDFRYACWKRASEDVKDLLTNMLAKDPAIRYSAEQVLKHRWFEGYRIKQNYWSSIPSQDFKDSLGRLNQFGNLSNSPSQNSLVSLVSYQSSRDSERKRSILEKRFMQGVVLFITAQLVHKKEKNVLHKIFQKIDQNADEIGTISKDELKQAFKIMYPDIDDDQLDYRIDKIFEFIDLNASGEIDYSEFIAATLKLDQQDIENKLKVAFDFFDENKDGAITLDELLKIMGTQVLEQLIKFKKNNDIQQTWCEIFNSNNSNLEKCITYNEFQTVIKNYLQFNERIRERKIKS